MRFSPDFSRGTTEHGGEIGIGLGGEVEVWFDDRGAGAPACAS
ncbi:hypothetical protein [Actinosynnema mirum]|uniref:Uncharacterized protein n=1 Tax=Actinosynnema mirum (strain ATCC 29888 / DSM 43827 / JCM 3225 / NBRC 14064 / NCIMB 13271 / NRRL B-12336 / IMRU 3971 / 101) TaxID=446462 RepID=C6WH62_ACTMD|nr:hypothetical protein [Actinosynnema mirum]ACU37981.1 hypothetical protein Amir_4126 [Actinosynnema mirum DSM 43827]AXX31476.1 hypothetical protein APASM_4111 [Actinosynnema pretiosum subsp. pretiosum]